MANFSFQMGLYTRDWLLLRSNRLTICQIEAFQACKNLLKAGIGVFDELGIGLSKAVKLPSFLKLRKSLTAGRSDWKRGILTQ